MVYYVPFKKFPLFTQNPDFLDSGNVKASVEQVLVHVEQEVARSKL